jgi:hypothetical protein
VCACAHVCARALPLEARGLSVRITYTKGGLISQAAAEESTNWRFAIAVSDWSFRGIGCLLLA